MLKIILMFIDTEKIYNILLNVKIWLVKILLS